MLKAYRYRIYPKAHQKNKIERSISICRMVYNLALETKIWAYKGYGVNLSSFDLCYQLTDLKKDYPWLYSVDSVALVAAVMKVDRSFNNFFNGKGFPKFKSKHQGNQSFQGRCDVRKVNWEKSTLTIPKIKNIPIRLSNRFYGKIKTITISRTATGKYFASILVDTADSVPKKRPINNAIGLDLGLTNFLTTDSGLKIDNPRYLRESIARLKVLQRKCSRKKKGGSNRKKANLRVARLYEKITNKRLDFIHKVTSGFVNDSQVDTFIMEDLNVKGMMANHSLAQAIGDVSWNKFREIMQYKCDWAGKNLLFIDRFAPSTKMCSVCGAIKEMPLSERIYSCHCGNVMDRDINAAINIKNIGLSAVGSRVEPLESSAAVGAVKEEFV